MIDDVPPGRRSRRPRFAPAKRWPRRVRRELGDRARHQQQRQRGDRLARSASGRADRRWMMSVMSERRALAAGQVAAWAAGRAQTSTMRAVERGAAGGLRRFANLRVFDWAGGRPRRVVHRGRDPLASDGYAAHAPRIAIALAEAIPTSDDEKSPGLSSSAEKVRGLRRCRRAPAGYRSSGPPCPGAQQVGRRVCCAARGSANGVCSELARARRPPDPARRRALELRGRPIGGEVLDGRGPRRWRRSARALAGREGVMVIPGNHDHHLMEPWLERRRSRAPARSELERVGTPGGARVRGARRGTAGGAEVRCAFPGIRGSATTSTRCAATASTAT